MACRISFSVIIFLSLYASARAQNGNSWMNPSGRYFKICVAEEGLYRISYQDLTNAGFPVATVDPRNIKLFLRGVEQAILVEGQNDGKFDEEDYLEFYGRQNDGTLDSALYSNSEFIPHSYYNLFSDSTAYFLIWSYGSDRGKRMESFSENNVNGLEASILWDQRVHLFTSSYSRGYSTLRGQISSSRLMPGEGFSGAIIPSGNQVDYEIEVGEMVQGSKPGELEIQLLGRSAGSHQGEVWIGASYSSLRLAVTASLNNYDSPRSVAEIQSQDISQGGRMIVRVMNTNIQSSQFSVSFIRTSIPVTANISLYGNTKIYLEPNASGKDYIELAGVPEPLTILDIKHPQSPRILKMSLHADTLKGLVDNTQQGGELLLVRNRLPITSLAEVSTQNLINPENSYLIITNRILANPSATYADPIEAYANYRSSAAGGSFKVQVIYIDEIYNRYSYGEKSPLGLFHFFEQIAADSVHVLLIGKGLDVSHNSERISQGTSYKNLIPTGGSPGSDILFAAGFDAAKPIPKFSIGRIPASNPQQVENYLNKVKVYESIKVPQPFQKRILHLSGGVNLEELNKFREYLDSMKQIAQDSRVASIVNTFQKKSTQSLEFLDITKEINEGVSLVTFFGHSASNILDIDIGYVTNKALGYDNYGRYPFFYMNG